MSNQSLGIGGSANDGTGDTLRAAADKVNDNFSEIYTLIGDGTTLTTGISSTGSVVTLTAPLITTSIIPTTADGASLGTSSAEFSDLFLADAAVINLGSDQDVTLTHVADTGVLLNSTSQLQFGDSGTYIHQSADGVLDLVSDTEIEINATTIDVNGNLDVSGTIVAAGALTAATSITVGSAVLTEAELETLDGITAGTVLASKVIITDSDKDITGGRNITISGELDAATGDFSGDVDVDGTLEADAITIGGVTLAETISDTVGAMVTSNTETGITVSYDDADNTLDFVIGTLNQDTTGSAATLTTARTIGGTSFDGSANIAVGLAATATALATARNIGGTSFDGTGDIAVALASVGTAVTVADESSDTTCFPLFTTAATGDLPPKSGTNLTFNSSSGLLTATSFAGALTGDVTGNLVGTVSTATQNSITTATSLVSVGALDSGSITSGFTSIDVGSGAISTTGTITYGVLNDGTTALGATAAELNILDASAGNTAVASDVSSSAGAITSNNAKIAHTLTLAAELADDAVHADVVVTSDKCLATSTVIANANLNVQVRIHTVVSGSFKVSITNLSGGALANDSTIILNYTII